MVVATFEGPDQARRASAVCRHQSRRAISDDGPSLRRLLQSILEITLRVASRAGTDHVRATTRGCSSSGSASPISIARPSPGIDDLVPSEYVEGWHILERKIRRYRPQIVALVGVTLYRAIRAATRAQMPIGYASATRPAPLIDRACSPTTIHGARVFVLPNPSGRNANFTYARDAGGIHERCAIDASMRAARRRGCRVGA